LIDPNYDSDGNNDLAIVWLSKPAPLVAERYTLYRSSDELGKTFTMVGYGEPGTGTYGADDNYSGTPLRQKAQNQFDIGVERLKASLGSSMGWNPLTGSQLMADFDDGTYAHDALARLVNVAGTGLGINEGLITPGDSGGPAFIGNQLAGIASYTASLSKSNVDPDIDSKTNSSYGEVAAWQRVSFYQQWIDQNLRAAYPNAPTKPEEVKQSVAEGNSGTTYAYFLLNFIGSRTNVSDILSVDYATRDGTAKAGSDYLETHGTLKLYPGENKAVIPVEIIGDTTPEPDETFYLDVTNPVGGSFGDGVVKLTAIRTILNDDWAIT
jgi:secreted trypsin-like serine protease